MPTTTNTKRENHQERANRIAPGIIEAERLEREKKTARLRALRLQKEQEGA